MASRSPGAHRLRTPHRARHQTPAPAKGRSAWRRQVRQARPSPAGEPPCVAVIRARRPAVGTGAQRAATEDIQRPIQCRCGRKDPTAGGRCRQTTPARADLVETKDEVRLGRSRRVGALDPANDMDIAADDCACHLCERNRQGRQGTECCSATTRGHQPHVCEVARAVAATDDQHSLRCRSTFRRQSMLYSALKGGTKGGQAKRSPPFFALSDGLARSSASRSSYACNRLMPAVVPVCRSQCSCGPPVNSDLLRPKSKSPPS